MAKIQMKTPLDLKVRLNYTDLSQVPGYEGPPATQQAQ